MATQSINAGICDGDDDGDGSQETAETNFPPQPSISPEPALNLQCNQKQLKTRTYPPKEVLPQKVFRQYFTKHQNNTVEIENIHFFLALLE